MNETSGEQNFFQKNKTKFGLGALRCLRPSSWAGYCRRNMGDRMDSGSSPVPPPRQKLIIIYNIMGEA